MAPIDRLPVELIFMICRFLHPTDIQMDLVYANKPEEDDDGIRSALRPGWTAVFSFSPVNKKYHHIIGNDLYHTIRVHGPSPRPLVSLLRLVTKKPDIGAAVKRLHLGLTYDDPAVKAAPLTAYDILFVGQVAAAAKLPCSKNMWRIPRRRQYRTYNDPFSDSITAYVEHGRSDFEELLYYFSGTVRTSLIVRLLLRELKNIEQLGCALPNGVFSWVHDDKWLNLGPRLPHLTTLAVRPDGLRFSGNDFGALSRLAPHAKCSYIEIPDFGKPEIGIAPQDKQTAFLQYSNVVLCGTTNPIVATHDVIEMLFKDLVAFKYISLPLSFRPERVLRPKAIILSLASHSATSLRSLCLDYSRCCPPAPPVTYSLRRFVNLETLQLHTSTFLGAYDPAIPDSENEPTIPNRVIKTLPASIQHLCFKGEGNIENDLDWIAESSTRFPKLCRVEVSDPDVANRLVQKFARVNVVLSVVKQ